MKDTLQKLIEEHGYEAVEAELIKIKPQPNVVCDPGYIYNPLTGKCVPDVGVGG